MNGVDVQRACLALAVGGLAVFAGVTATTSPQVALAAIGVLALGLMCLVRPVWLLTATVLLGCTTLPTSIPQTMSIGGFALNAYEPLLALGAAWVVLRPGPSTRLVRGALAILPLFPLAGVALGLLFNNDLRWIVYDARGPIVLALAAVVGAAVWLDPILQRSVLRAVLASLWISVVCVLAASLGILEVNGRVEDVGLYLDGRPVSSDATRILGGATHFALGVACLTVALVIRRKASMRQVLPYLIPAVVITVLAFSRNSLLGLAVAMAAAVIAAPGRGLPSLLKVAMASIACGVVAWTTLYMIGGAPLDYVNRQATSYRDRVADGLSRDVLARDSSVEARSVENRYVLEAWRSAPLVGGGFGASYRPPFGPTDSFGATYGQYYVHNWYGWLAVKTGVLGLGWVLAATLIPALRSLRRREVAFGSAGLGLLAVSAVAPLANSLTSAGALALGGVIGVCAISVSRDSVPASHESAAIEVHAGQ